MKILLLAGCLVLSAAVEVSVPQNQDEVPTGTDIKDEVYSNIAETYASWNEEITELIADLTEDKLTPAPLLGAVQNKADGLGRLTKGYKELYGGESNKAATRLQMKFMDENLAYKEIMAGASQYIQGLKEEAYYVGMEIDDEALDLASAYNSIQSASSTVKRDILMVLNNNNDANVYALEQSLKGRIDALDDTIDVYSEIADYLETAMEQEETHEEQEAEAALKELDAEVNELEKSENSETVEVAGSRQAKQMRRRPNLMRRRRRLRRRRIAKRRRRMRRRRRRRARRQRRRRRRLRMRRRRRRFRPNRRRRRPNRRGRDVAQQEIEENFDYATTLVTDAMEYEADAINEIIEHLVRLKDTDQSSYHILRVASMENGMDNRRFVMRYVVKNHLLR